MKYRATMTIVREYEIPDETIRLMVEDGDDPILEEEAFFRVEPQKMLESEPFKYWETSATVSFQVKVEEVQP